MDGAIVYLSVSHGFLHGLEGALEHVGAGFFEPVPGDGGVAIDSLDGQDGDVEGITNKIKDEHVVLYSSFLLVRAVGDGRLGPDMTPASLVA